MSVSAAPLPRITVVDDEEHLLTTLAQAFHREGFAVSSYSDGRAAWEEMENNLPDLVILDIVMPGMDGLELCRKIRSLSTALPVIFLTSRDEEFDRVLGLELGADDYLCKPFSLRELVARVRVLLRRSALAAGNREQSPADTVAAGSLFLDAERFAVSWKGSPIKLTVTEFRILMALARRPGFVRSREDLLSAAFPQDSYMSDRTVDCHIKRIRKKITDADSGFDRIETVYGLGYRWREGAA
jgi:two-component system response regulator ChvI